MDTITETNTNPIVPPVQFISPEAPITKKYKKLIIIITVISGLLSIYTIYFTLQSLCSDGIGCIGLAPFYAPVLPAYPAVMYLGSFGDLQMALASPSLFKFYAFFVIFFTYFIELGILAAIIIYRKSR